MRTSDTGIKRVEEFEGLRLHAYPDPATGGEPWTIGYGHTGGVRPGETITQEQAQQFLRDDLRATESAIQTHVHVPLSQGQFDALVSLVYNIGIGAFWRSTLLARLNGGHYAKAANHFADWKWAGGRPMLAGRRGIERAAFLAASNRKTRAFARMGVR